MRLLRLAKTEVSCAIARDDASEDKWPAADLALEAAIQRYWVNFARTGDPNGPGLVRWAPYRVGRSALWFSQAAAKAGRVLREDKLRAMDEALRRIPH